MIHSRSKIFGCLFMMLGMLSIAPQNTTFAQGAGRIVGQVTASDTEQPLSAANVTLQGTNIGTATNVDGEYVLAGVPEGTYTIQASYLGFTTATKTVTVEEDEETEVDFELAPQAVEMGGVTVMGVRARNQAQALNRQMNAMAIKNIVTTDRMGKFPGTSAPQTLKRLPGISIQRDQGEARYVQIRGGAPAYTKVTFNGTAMPSPEGEKRQVAMDAIPVSILKAVEVSKAITPDMDATAIGGAVNLVTKKAPAERLFSISAEAGYGTLRSDWTGKASTTYGDRFADDKLGLLLSLSYRNRPFGSDDVEPIYDLGNGPNLSDDGLAELSARHYTITRRRLGGTAAIDYRIGEHSTIYANAILTQLSDYELTRELLHVPEDGALEYIIGDRWETTGMLKFKAGGEHRLNEAGAMLTYSASWTRSSEHQPNQYEIVFLQEGVSFAPDLSNPGYIRSNPSSTVNSSGSATS